MTMTNNDISGGVVHDLPEDLRNTLAADAEARASWEDLTPLARNLAVGMAVFTARIRQSALRYSMCSTNKLKSHDK